jgi:alanyl-tRNA synthetase
VVDVLVRERDEVILHVLEQPLPGSEAGVVGEIDWDRRFDHMQQHTGQHILSQAFIRVADAHTIGFHLSDESVTIDLNVDALTPEQLAQAETLANQIVWENRPIHIQMVTLEEARQMPLRKLPPAPNGKLRLIEIEDFDLTACGGTHVARTGAVGLIKLIKTERIRGQARIEFTCGGRALADYGRKNETVQQLMANLTTSQDDLAVAVARLQQENKQARRTLKKMKTAVLQAEAERLLSAGQKQAGFTLITHVFDESDNVDLRVLGSQLTRQSQVVALLGVAGKKSQLLFTRSDDAPGDMNALLQSALQELGQGGGGGTAVAAQGGGPGVSDGRLRQAITFAAQKLLA